MSLLSICTLSTLYYSPTKKIDHHDCVCVIIINKSPCQVCVCISKSGRNKTQLAGKKDSLRRRKKHLPSKFEKLLANSKFNLHLASWRVLISTPGLLELLIYLLSGGRISCFLSLFTVVWGFSQEAQ
jgi:hypothetical protein